MLQSAELEREHRREPEGATAVGVAEMLVLRSTCVADMDEDEDDFDDFDDNDFDDDFDDDFEEDFEDEYDDDFDEEGEETEEEHVGAGPLNDNDEKHGKGGLPLDDDEELDDADGEG